MRETISKSFTDHTIDYTLAPKTSISDLFGLIKLHKEERPLRPICTGYSSLCANAENYLKKLLSPLTKNFKFLVESTKDFAEKFKTEKAKFDQSKHTLVSFDIVQLYTRVNTNRAISIILDAIYKQPDTFFTEKDEFGRLSRPRKFSKIPSRSFD